MKNFQVCLVLVLLTALWCRCVTAQVQHLQADRLLLGDPTSTGVDKCIANSWNQGTFAETVYVDDGSLPIASDEEKQRGYLVFQRHWMDLIFPGSIPKTDELTSRLSLVASPGEYEPASFCIRTLKELTGLQLSASELVSEDGHRIAAPQLRIVRCVPRAWQGEEWLYQDGPVGVMNMPTYLESPRVLDIARGRTVQFWVTVKVERDANPGAYQGEIHVRHEQGPAHVIAIEINVQAIALAEPPQTLGFWDFRWPYTAEAITRGLFHDGKPYDFDFDFTRSDRLVCTEVVYRSYEGIGGLAFELTRRAGRMTLAAEDLLRMAIDRVYFDPMAVYAPSHASDLLVGDATGPVIRDSMGGA